LFCSSANAITLAGPDPCNTLDNWTTFYTGNVIENGTIHLGNAVGKGVGWTTPSFSGNRTIIFNFIDFDTLTDDYFAVYLNGSMVLTRSGWYVRLDEGGEARLYNPNGTYEVYPVSQSFSNNSLINISTSGSQTCVIIDGISLGTLDGGNTSGYVEFRTIASGAETGVDNFTVTDDLTLVDAGSGDGGGDAAATGPYYVSTEGSDEADGSFGTPWATITHAYDTAPDGAFIYILDGEHQIPSKITNGISNSTLAGYGENAIIYMDYEEYYGNDTLMNANYKRINLLNIAVTSFGGGFLGVGTNTTVENIHMYNTSGIAETSAKTMIDISNGVKYITINGSRFNDTAMATPLYPYGSISPNIIGVNGPTSGGATEYITITNNSFGDNSLHATINLASNSYNDVYGDGEYHLGNVEIGYNTFGPYLNRFSSPSNQLNVIANNKGPITNLNIHDNTFTGIEGSVATAAIVANMWDGTIEGNEFNDVSYYCIWLQDLYNTPTSSYIYPHNVTVSNNTETGTLSAHGVFVDGGYELYFINNSFHRYGFNHVNDTWIIDQFYDGEVYLRLPSGATSEITIQNTDGQLFIEDLPNDLIVNETGAYLYIPTTTPRIDYGFENINYSMNTTSAVVSDVSAIDCNVTLVSSENVTFTELDTGNTTEVSLPLGTTHITFSELDFVTGESFIITSFTPTNTTPTSVNGTEQEFSINTNLESNVTWYIDSVEVQTNTSVTSASYTNSTANVGEYVVLASAYDGSTYANQSWTWTVTEVPVTPTDTISWDDILSRAQSDTENAISLGAILPVVIISGIIISLIIGMAYDVIEFETGIKAILVMLVVSLILMIALPVFNSLYS